VTDNVERPEQHQYQFPQGLQESEPPLTRQAEAFCHLDLGAENIAIVGREYDLIAGIRYSNTTKADGQLLAELPNIINFQLLAHTSDNLEVLDEEDSEGWHKKLATQPADDGDQQTSFRVKSKAAGPNSAAVEYYRENAYMGQIRFTFDSADDQT
jgi:hypothetical protein